MMRSPLSPVIVFLPFRGLFLVERRDKIRFLNFVMLARFIPTIFAICTDLSYHSVRITHFIFTQGLSLCNYLTVSQMSLLSPIKVNDVTSGNMTTVKILVSVLAKFHLALPC